MKMRTRMNGSGKENLPFLIAVFLVLLILAGLHFMDAQAGALAGGDLWLTGRYLAVAALAILAAVLLGYLLLCAKARLETIFVLAALVFGALYLYVLPPLSAPDEISHYISAYRLSNQMMGVSAEWTHQIPVREEDWFAEDSQGTYKARLRPDGLMYVDEEGAADAQVLGQTLTEETYRQIHEKGLWGFEEKREPINVADDGMAVDESITSSNSLRDNFVLSTANPVRTTAAAYFFPALGITLARLLGLNSLGLLYLGRIANLLFYTVSASYAMRRLPYGKEVLFGVGLLPMTIHLTASFSYDVLLLSGMFVLTAVCLDLAAHAERVRMRDVVLMVIIMAAAGPCKIVYVSLAGLCLLVPVKKFGGWKRWGFAAAAVLGAWVLAMLLLNGATVGYYSSGEANYVDWAGEPGYMLGTLISQPLRCCKLLYQTLVWQTGYYYQTMLGGYLGNLDELLDVPWPALVLLTVCLFGLLLRKPGENLWLTGGRRIWVWCVCVLCSGLLLLSMLISLTPLSASVITGVQGRYFLPLLPVLLMSMKNDLVVLTKDVSRECLFLMVSVNAYVVMRVFATVCLRV